VADKQVIFVALEQVYGEEISGAFGLGSAVVGHGASFSSLADDA
jgi:hypothetical protein